MKLDTSKPILYLITPGESTEATTPNSSEFNEILRQVSAAASAGIDLIQIREKRMTARVLYELTEHAAALTRGSATQLLVNDRADIAASAGADGVHLATQSIDAATMRRTFAKEFLIGVSTHSPAEAHAARDDGADFVVFGPVFATPSKQNYGAPSGVGELKRVVTELRPFPVLALGGITRENFELCMNAGASGIAGISLFEDASRLAEIVAHIRR